MTTKFESLGFVPSYQSAQVTQTQPSSALNGRKRSQASMNGDLN